MNIIPHVSILNLPLANVEPINLSYGRSIINELDIIIPAAIATNNMNQNIKNFMKINNANFENLLQVNNDELPYLLQKIIEKNKEFQKYLNKYFNDKKNLPTYFFYLHLNPFS